SWLIDSAQTVAIADQTQVVVPGPPGPFVLDYTTGRTAPLRPGATYWCMTLAKYEAFPRDGVPARYKRVGGMLASMCDAKPQPTAVIPSAASTLAAGARAGDYVVLAGAHGYVGFKLH